jgi:pimeloyl-ACP methyl ester carboxylesterase
MAAALPVILVHGTFHGAWCWSALQAELDKRGVPSYAVDLPGHGTSPLPLEDLVGDAQSVTDLLERLGGEVVLVGHSYGGAVISQAGTAGTVANLVYVTAMVPDVGQSAFELFPNLPHGEVATRAFRRHSNGTLTANTEVAVDAFYGRCPSLVAKSAVARLCPQRLDTHTQRLTAAAWRTIPSTFVRCLRDQAHHIERQNAASDRCTDTVTLDTDHSPFMSAPAALAQVLAGLAVN